MKCDVHKDRGGILFVDLPSIGVRRWGCLECRMNFDKSMLNYSPRRAARRGERIWEQFGGRMGETDSAHNNPNAVYERAQSQHTIDRSKE
jgi:hypothetical protein